MCFHGELGGGGEWPLQMPDIYLRALFCHHWAHQSTTEKAPLAAFAKEIERDKSAIAARKACEETHGSRLKVFVSKAALIDYDQNPKSRVNRVKLQPINRRHDLAIMSAPSVPLLGPTWYGRGHLQS